MYTLTNAYQRKLSSGTIVALLVLSGLLFLVPGVATVHAVQNPTSAYTVSQLYNVYVSSTLGDLNTITITNAGPYALLSITVSVPSGWSIGASDADECGTFLTTVLVSGSAITCSSSGGLPAGQTTTINLGDITPPSSSASSAATVSTFTTTLVDGGSSPASYAGPSLTYYVIASTSIAGPALSGLQSGTSNFVAGSAALTLTSAVTSGQAGVPVTFSSNTAGGTFTPSSGQVSTSGGVATATYAPTNTVTASITLTATINTVAAITGTDTFGVVAGPPSTVTVTAGGSSTKTDYLQGAASFGTPGFSTSTYAKVASGGVTGVVADAFGNAVASGISAESCTLTSFGGSFDSAGTAVSTNSVAAGASCSTAGAVANTLAYYQSAVYGSTSYIQVIMTGTYNGASFTASGKSQTISTSTIDSGTSNTPTVSPAAGTISAGSAAGVVSTITVTYTLTTAQAGVPVTFFGVNSTNCGSTAAGTCQFVGGTGITTHPPGKPGAANDVYASVVASTTVTSGVGTATATFTIDPTLSAIVAFKAQVAAPVTGTPSNTLALSSATGSFTTGPGAISKLGVVACFTATGCPTTTTTKTVAAQTDYLDVVLQDFWGNTATNSGGQLQIALAISPSSSGTLSASNVYIPNGFTDTKGGFGTITFVINSGVTGSISITATGLYSGSGSLTIVSASPTVTVATPSGTSGHVIYSGLAGVAYSGSAAVSAGVYPAPTISSVSYTIDGGSATTATGTTSWSFVATLTAGLHTVAVWSKDSTGALSATNSTTVLVDTSAPTITAPSTLSYGAGSAVVFTITDSLGDLKASSVTVSVNGTALTAGASSGQTFTVSGTNNPGSSVTYSVAVTGLSASTGHYGITVGASDWAGNAAAAVTAVVKVTVAFASSVVISGTATQATIGGFSGISVSYTNGWTSSQNLIVFAVWKNSAGQTVAVSTSGLTLASGATGTAFAPLASALPSGSYTVNIFVWTTGNLSVSQTTTITASF